ncbi:hypothetical protein DITRI_Ditri20bG0006200 [Diplodiscus trichospermus]
MEHAITVLDEDASNTQNFDSLSGKCLRSTPEVNLIQAFQTLPNLGLRLSRTPSFLNKLDQLVQGQNSNGGDQLNNNYGYATDRAKSKDTNLQNVNKMKAENFSILLLRIGTWQRISKNEGDLVAKCYFAKRKLVWEFLENGLKKKIEIQWSDILSFKAVMQEDKPGILEIELNQPPTFHHEIDPQPRKHTQWKMVSDFTGGQAPTFRRHYLEFPPRALDRPLEKLLTCDSRLFHLSRQSFPTLPSPFFEKHTFGIDLDFGGQGYCVNFEQQQFSFPNVMAPNNLSQYVPTYDQATQKTINLSDGHIMNQMPLWGQQMNNVGGGISFGAVPNAIVNSTSILPQNSHTWSYNQPVMKNQYGGQELQQVMQPTMAVHPTLAPLQEAESHQIRCQILNELQNIVSSNSQTPESNLHRDGNPANATNVTANYAQNMVDNAVVMSNNLSSNAGSLIYPQAASSWPPSQAPRMNQLHANNSFFDPSMEYYHPAHGNDWTWKSL